MVAFYFFLKFYCRRLFLVKTIGCVVLDYNVYNYIFSVYNYNNNIYNLEKNDSKLFFLKLLFIKVEFIKEVDSLYRNMNKE